MISKSFVKTNFLALDELRKKLPRVAMPKVKGKTLRVQEEPENMFSLFIATSSKQTASSRFLSTDIIIVGESEASYCFSITQKPIY